MPSQYNLKIKATLDTSQVQQELNKLKVPGGAGGGSPAPGGGGAGGANQEIINAAKKVNLGALAGGFNLLSREMNKLSQTLGGDGLTKRIGDLAQSANGAIAAFRAFGAPGAAIYVAMEAINAWADSVMASVDTFNQAAAVIGRIGAERRTEKAQERYAGMSDKDLSEARDRAKAALEDAKNKEIEVARVAGRMGEIANDLALRGQLGRADELNAHAKDAMSDAANRTSEAKSILALIDAEFSKRKSTAAPDIDYTAQGSDALDKFFDSIRNWAEMSESEYNDFSSAASDAEAKLRRFAEIIEGGFAITEEQKRQIEELTETYNVAKDRMSQYEQRRSRLEEERAREEAAAQAEKDREDARRTSAIAGQNKYFANLDFDRQLGVYADQAGTLTDTQRANMERRRGTFEAENAELRRLAEAGQEIDLGKFQENARKIADITNILDKDATAKDQGNTLPAWLDGIDDRTNDWIHNIGGNVAGENTIQNQEFQLMKEMERLLRENTEAAKRTAQYVA